MRILLEKPKEDYLTKDQVKPDHFVILKTNENGWIMLIRKIDPYNKIYMGWKLNDIPNGDYYYANDEEERPTIKYATLKEWFNTSYIKEAYAFDTYKEAFEFLITVL